MVALIPARAGSKRIPGKNIRLFEGHPLMAYTIVAAQQSGVFEGVYVCTEDAETAAIARRYGAVVIPRSAASAADDAADILWVREAMTAFSPRPDTFAILRPTSPFRTAATIRRAAGAFAADPAADSLRAVDVRDGPHPGKMWVYHEDIGRITPVMKDWLASAPYHSSPTQSFLGRIVRQNASLEMARTAGTLDRTPPTIAGEVVAPFFTDAAEGVDLNTESDWSAADTLIRVGCATLPEMAR